MTAPTKISHGWNLSANNILSIWKIFFQCILILSFLSFPSKWISLSSHWLWQYPGLTFILILFSPSFFNSYTYMDITRKNEMVSSNNILTIVLMWIYFYTVKKTHILVAEFDIEKSPLHKLTRATSTRTPPSSVLALKNNLCL